MLVLVPLLLAPQASEVLVVDAFGAGDYLTIQAAIDAAPPGAVILVHPSSYDGFAVVDKALTILVDGSPGSARIQGSVRIAAGTAGKEVVLSGLEIEGEFPEQDGVAVTVDGWLGSVRMESCALIGSDNLFQPLDCEGFFNNLGGDALLVKDSPNVAVVATTARGGRGVVQCDELFPECCGFVTSGGQGGDGLDLRGSRLAAFDSSFQGGDGGSGGWGGNGGFGIRVGFDAGPLVMSGVHAQGGAGGLGFDYIFGPGGNGAAGILSEGTSYALDSTFAGGAGGPSVLFSAGAPGTPTFGAAPLPWTGSARSLTLSAPVSELGSFSIGVQGEPGDLAFAFSSYSQSFLLLEALHGVALVGTSKAFFLGACDPSGLLQLTVPVGALPPGHEALRFAAQLVCLTGAGGVAIGPPRHQVILDATL